MKKSTLKALVSYLEGQTVDNLPEIHDELVAELNRNAEKAAANRELYNAAKGIALRELGTTPVTASELYEAVADELPTGFTKGKLSWALNNIWADSVVRIDGKVKTYTRAS